MTRAYRRGGRTVTAPGIELDQHEDVSRVLAMMATQAKGLRSLVRQATGGGSAPYRAATGLLKAVQALQQVLLGELDRVYGAQAPPMTRTRYCKKG
jgi:alkylation response protein AidB-like acyl-CoA dehydrogenase